MVHTAVKTSLAPSPRSDEEIGLSESVLTDLMLRRVLFDGRISIGRMAELLGLPAQLLEPRIRRLREDKRYLDYETMIGNDWVVALTPLGRQLAEESMKRLSYAGIAPVPLDVYRAVVAAQSGRPVVTRAQVRTAFQDLVVNDRLVDEVGPAIMGEGAIFLYGPPGTGKSSVAERMVRLLGDDVLIPHAIEVDGSMIAVYDPTAHVAVDPQPPGLDRRWVLCRRPNIVVGGELVRAQLDLVHDPKSGLHLAPLQLKANNGMLVIDDFGRQQMSPTELLNRWIVPLDRHVDYLTLAWGVRFDVPFDARVVFSTNLEPSTLGDEAFFRRLPNKVFVGPIEAEQFDRILIACGNRHGVRVEEGWARYLRRAIAEHGDGDLRPYVPNVVCQLAKAICIYEGQPVELHPRIIDRVASLYFTKLSGRCAPPERLDPVVTAEPQLAGAGFAVPVY